ncbi:MAG TPA: TetR/AcrR family transcriptional regulator [Caulobacteraceae bacterium]|nr:TetR/AcrR family transcriptional regulator [Caulobacteraceae bacterium]
MSVEESSPVRRRRTSEDARAEALAAARKILLGQGPEALTLKAVAAEVGVTHANLLHHFGSAGGLRTELMAKMLRDLSETLREVIGRLRAGEASMDEVVNLTFDAFDAGGASHLAAWMVLNRDTDQLEPIGEVVRELADAIRYPDHPAEVDRAILFVTMMAFADGVVGKYLRAMLGQPNAAARELTAQLTPFATHPERI